MELKDYLPVFGGKVAAISFLFSVTSLHLLSSPFSPLLHWHAAALELAYLFGLSLFWSLSTIKIIFASHCIGIVFAVGGLFVVHGDQGISSFGFYAMALAFFHISEYIVTAIFNSHTLSMDSFLINHSWAYGIAAISSWVEFFLEYYFFPDLKALRLVTWVGIVLVVFGETLRKAAMFTAASNFTHVVQYHKRRNHVLVTQGVYSLFRHPSYVGWFYWSVGTQFVLCNPVCLVCYAAASWLFFNDRIWEEEEYLIQFFKEDYVEYKKRVGTGIPFIRGFPIDKLQ